MQSLTRNNIPTGLVRIRSVIQRRSRQPQRHDLGGSSRSSVALFVRHRHHSNNNNNNSNNYNNKSNNKSNAKHSQEENEQSRHQPQLLFADHLKTPQILYSDNHIVAVNKPAGWHSVPNPPKDDAAAGGNSHCLITYGQERGWGGGSQGRFLLPLHRIDQPCTGILLLGKTHKAASRIQSQWHNVQKTYYCVIEHDDLSKVREASSQLTSAEEDDDGDYNYGYDDNDNDEVNPNQEFQLNGILIPSKTNKNRSVKIIPAEKYRTEHSNSHHQLCSLTWRLAAISNVLVRKTRTRFKYAALRIETNLGRRHMIRALLAQVGSAPICGDVRYADHRRRTLPDQSIALHAYSLTLPEDLQLGGPESGLAGKTMEASIPQMWKRYFDIRKK